MKMSFDWEVKSGPGQGENDAHFQAMKIVDFRKDHFEIQAMLCQTFIPYLITICKKICYFDPDYLILNLYYNNYAVPTHNKHIFVTPKKVCLFWEMCLLW